MELGEVYVKIGADIVPLEKALGKARGVTKKTTEQMRAQMKTIGMGMVIAGAAITAAFALTVKSAISFQKQLAQVSTMLDESAMKIMPKYKAGLLEMSAAFGESTDTLSRGLYDILSASIPPAQALEVLAVAATAATAGVTDTGVAADAITTILNSYGFSADKAGEVSDKLFAIVKRGKLTFDELAPAIGKTAAMAAKTGLSFDELGAMIATLTRAGIRTDEAMTSINGVLRAFLKPSDEAKEAAGAFGLTMDTTTIKTIGLRGAMDKLKTATAEQLAQIFPNIRGLKGLIAALGDVEGYTKDYELMLNSAGLTQIAFAKQSATLGFKIEQLKKSFNVIAVTVGDVLIPVIQSIVERIGKFVLKMKEWMDAHPGLTKVVVLLGAALGVFTMAGGLLILGVLYFTKLNETMRTVMGTSKAMVPSLAKLRLSINTLNGAILVVSANLIIWSEVWREWKKVKASKSLKELNEDLKAVQENTARMQEELADKLGLTVEEFKKYTEAGMGITEMFNLGTIASESYASAMADLIEKAKEGKISASELYRAFLELEGVEKEIVEDAKTITTTVKDLTQAMSFLAKEYELTNKSISESIDYYTAMIEKVNQVDVILQTELMLLKEGTEEWYKKKEEILDNLKVLKELTASLEGLTEPLEGLELIAAKMALLGDSIGEIPAKLELLREKAVLLKQALDEAIPKTEAWWEAKDAYEANQKAIEELAGSFDEYGKKGKALLASLIELTNKQKELQEAIDVVGVDKQSEAYRYLKTEYNANEAAIASLIAQINNLAEAERQAEEDARNLADAYKEITDKIYELTHTPMENAIRKLDEQKQEYIDLGTEIGLVNKWYDLQIEKLRELNPELDKTTKKLEESGEVAKEAGMLGSKSWEGLTAQIKHASVALSTFTKEGVAAAIATVKMNTYKLIQHIKETSQNATGIFRKMAESNIAMLEKTMRSQIDAMIYGYKEYLNILNVMSGGSPGAKPKLPSFQYGTPYVPKTGMAMLHRGEAVIPANQNNYNTFSPTLNMTVQGGGDASLIAYEVKKVLDETAVQFRRG